MDGADVGLVGRVGDGVVEAAQRAKNLASTSAFLGSSRRGLDPWRARPGTWASTWVAALDDDVGHQPSQLHLEAVVGSCTGVATASRARSRRRRRHARSSAGSSDGSPAG